MENIKNGSGKSRNLKVLKNKDEMLEFFSELVSEEEEYKQFIFNGKEYGAHYFRGYEIWDLDDDLDDEGETVGYYCDFGGINFFDKSLKKLIPEGL